MVRVFAQWFLISFKAIDSEQIYHREEIMDDWVIRRNGLYGVYLSNIDPLYIETSYLIAE